MRLFLDEGVPVSVGAAFEEAGHEVLYFHDHALAGSKDPVVCAISEKNKAILVAIDGDMKKMLQARGVSGRRFKTLSLIKLSCRETRAAKRVREAMSLIEHEWAYGEGRAGRQLFIEILDQIIRTVR